MAEVDVGVEDKPLLGASHQAARNGVCRLGAQASNCGLSESEFLALLHLYHHHRPSFLRRRQRQSLNGFNIDEGLAGLFAIYPSQSQPDWTCRKEWSVHPH